MNEHRLSWIAIAIFLGSFGVMASDYETAVQKLKSGDARSAARLLENVVKGGDGRYEVLLYLGNAYFLSGQVDKAIKIYESAISINTSAREAFVNLASAYSAAGRHSEAIKQYHAVLDKWGENVDVNYNLAVAYRFSGDLKEAEFYAKKAHELNPADGEMVGGLGEILELMGRVDDARNLYIADLKAHPRNIRPRVNLARLYLNRGNFSQAEKEARSAVEADPNYYAPHLVLGDLFRAKGDMDVAIYEYRAAVSRNPNNSEANARLGSVYEDLNDVENAKNFYGDALRCDERSLEVTIKLGSLLLRSGDYFGAKEVLTRAQDKVGKSATLFDLMGVTYLRLHNFEKSEYWFMQALELDSLNQKVALDFGMLRFEQNRITEALELLEKSAKQGYETYDLHYFLGRSYFAKKRYGEALEQFKKLPVSDVKAYAGYLWIGKSCEQMGSMGSAEASYLKGIEVCKTNPDAWFEAADFYYRNRMVESYEKCSEYFEKTLELDSKYPKRDQIVLALEQIKAKINRNTNEKNEKEVDDEQRQK